MVFFQRGEVLFAVLLVCLVFLRSPGYAEVAGLCSNCHTMHNSQDGGMVVDSGPDRSLLKYDCLGCHSDTGGETVLDMGGCQVPIVLNHVEPGKPLAGGNFYWVEHGDDANGHNVITVDGNLSSAPGSIACGFEGCHVSLASIRYGTGPGPLFNPITGIGCIGCHDTRGAHHKSGQDLGNGYRLVGVPGDGTKGFRFLAQVATQYWNVPPHNPPCVMGIEAPWDVLQNPGVGAHNEYQDALKPGAYCAYMGRPQGISDFCAGCHQDYHTWQTLGYPNGGEGDDPWFRHPSSVTIPATGEYAGYTEYDVNVPVARDYTVLAGMSAPSSVVTPGQDQVMCLSCHYAHAGPYPDALRWDYAQVQAGGGGNVGCLRCHTHKGL